MSTSAVSKVEVTRGRERRPTTKKEGKNGHLENLNFFPPGKKPLFFFLVQGYRNGIEDIYHGGDLLRGVGLLLALDDDLHVGLALPVHDVVRHALLVVLDLLVVEATADETLHIEHRVLRVDCGRERRERRKS